MRLFSQFSLACTLALLISWQAVADTTLYRVKVDSTAPSPDGASWATAYPDIQTAIDAAVANGASEVTPAELWVATGTYTATTDPVITLAEHVYLYGGFVGEESTREARDWATNTTTLEGEESRRCVLGADNATLDGFTLQQGAAGNGGGMYNEATSPAVLNCRFTNNKAWSRGGSAMYNCAGAAPSLTNCWFFQNSTFSYGAGIYNDNASPILTACTFEQNIATECGGGMYNDAASPILTACLFLENAAEDKWEDPDIIMAGGGIYNTNGAAPTLTDCTFTGNRAECQGGGIYNDASAPTLSSCSFTQNTADCDGGGMANITSSPQLHACAFTENTARYSGGGMYNGFTASPVLESCIFTGNSSEGSGGGMENTDASPTLRHCSFTENSAKYSGGGMNNYRTSSPVVEHCSFIGNTAGSRGGGMSNDQSAPVVRNALFSGNTANEGGGGMYNEDASPMIRNTTFSKNSGGILSQNASATLINCIVWGNPPASIQETSSTNDVSYSNIQGGWPGAGNIDAPPLFVDKAAGDYRLGVNSPCLDSGAALDAPIEDIRGIPRPQAAGVEMGAYEMPEAELSALDSDADGMTDAWEARYAIDDPHGDPDGDGATNLEEYRAGSHPLRAPGAGVWYVDVNNSTGHEDGLAWESAFSELQPAVAEAAAVGGGEIWVAAGTYTATGAAVVAMVEGVHLYGGFAGGESELAQRDYLLNIALLDGEERRRCVTGANNAILDGFSLSRGAADNGGGLYNYFASPTVRNCTFTANTAFSGGGIYNYESAPVITDCRFSSNTATGSGGGIYSYILGPVLTNCTFTANTAEENGGALYSFYASADVTACTFRENAADNGGGMYSYRTSLSVTGCRFTRNTASRKYDGLWGGGGGAIYNEATEAVAVTNCIFSENTALSSPSSEGCGAIFNYNAAATITNCTFWRNRGGLYTIGFTPTATNCIFWENLPYEIQGNTSLVYYSTIQGGYEGEGNIALPPLFVDPEGGDFRLGVNSPCLDAGTAAGAPSADLRGIARPQAEGIEMGAYEMPEAELSALDSDGDGMTDAWEARYGVEEANADPDADGATNLEEYRAQTHPLLPPDAIWYVDGRNASGNEDGRSWGSAYTSLQAAVAAAASAGGGEIWVAGGVYTAPTPCVLQMAAQVHLYGGFAGDESSREARDWESTPSIIDGEESRRCVLGADNATLDGFTLTRGYTEAGGGGMYNAFAAPVLSNCLFSENAAAYGGGIYNNAASPRILHCSFVANTATVEGRIGGGGIYNQAASPVLEACTFTQNSGATGGGMANADASSPVLRECSFLENRATVRISEYVAPSGGAMANLDSSPSVTNCRFSGNRANSLVYDGGESSYGGGIYNAGAASLTLNTCHFTQNSADDGGGIYNAGAASLTLNTCHFTQNSASDGGGIYSDELCSTEVRGCRFTENTAYKGAGIYAWKSVAALEGCTFIKNEAEQGGGFYNGQCTSVEVLNCSFRENRADMGGGLYNAGRGDTLISNCSIIENTAKKAGGGLCNYSSTIVTNTIVWGNRSDQIYNGRNASPSITYSCVQAETPYEGVGNINTDPLLSADGLRVQPDSPCIDRGDPEAAGVPESDILGQPRMQQGRIDMGATEYIPGTALVEVTVTLDGDSGQLPALPQWATEYHAWIDSGAPIACYPGRYAIRFSPLGQWRQPEATVLTVPEGQSTYRVAFTYTHSPGASLWLVSQAASGDNNGSSWEDAFLHIQSAVDAATLEGGGEIWVAAGDYQGEIGRATVLMAENVHLYGGFAGGETSRSERNWTANPTLINGRGTRHCAFGADHATLDGFTLTQGYRRFDNGGGLYNDFASPTVAHCTFMENSADDCGGGMYNQYSSPSVTHCTFTGNRADHSGGGMYNIHFSSPIVMGCSFTNNTALYGAAMRNRDSSQPTITTCSFSQNAATYSGGGIDTACSLELINCLFTENTAEANGGALLNTTASLSMTNCTLASNTAAQGSGIYNWNASHTAINCIFWDNLPYAMQGAEASEFSISYSNIQGGWEGPGNINALPAFIDSATGDWRLGMQSPCLDSGASAPAPATDIRGIARPQEGGVDMGAFEMAAADFVALDTDGDGMADEWEARYGVDDPAGDPDGDNATNLEEFIAGTHPMLAPGLLCYVDAANSAGNQDGRTWESAYTSLQAGVDLAALAGGGEVWAAAGTYTATTELVLSMAPNVELYGGFDGSESTRDQRNYASNITIIDGEQCRRCVLGADNARLDGFTITQGYAYEGGGMLNNNASPWVSNCIFRENTAAYAGGGAMYNSFSNPELVNCVFIHNTATGTDYNAGGGLYNTSSSPVILNCTFTANTAALAGGGMYSYQSAPAVANSIFWGNSPEDLFTADEGSSLVIRYSCVGGAISYPGIGNINTNPFFAADGFRLHAWSPCIDSADPESSEAFDILGVTRPQGGGYDMGACEYVEGAGEGEGASTPEVHNGDYDGLSPVISLSELLRFIQFFNSGGYHCAQPDDITDEGFMPGPGGTACPRHTGDYALPPWEIELGELLRFIQFFNTGGYHPCDDPLSDEGYCPGPPESA